MNYQKIQDVSTNIVSAKVDTIISEIYCVRTNDLLDNLNPLKEVIIALLLESNQITKQDLGTVNPNNKNEIIQFLTDIKLDSVLSCFELLDEKMIAFNDLSKVLEGFQFILNTLEQTGFTIFDMTEKVTLIQHISYLMNVIKESQKNSLYDYFLLLNNTTKFIEMNENVPNQFI